MMTVVLVVVLGAAAVAVAWFLQRRDRAEPERAPTWHVPTVVDRNDFERPDAPWLVAVFSSSTCLACQDTWEKAKVLAADAVAVQEVEAVADKQLHERYGIDAVPLVLLVDDVGLVRRHFMGPPSTSDLWSALAELRDA